MYDYLRTISLFIVLGFVVNALSTWIKSDFLGTFLDENLITLLFALLAINTTTTSVIMTKLKEITDKTKADFNKSIKSLKNAIFEQVIILILASIALILKSSNVLNDLWLYSGFLWGSLSIAIFGYAVSILCDTANGIFVILDSENKEQKKSKELPPQTASN